MKKTLPTLIFAFSLCVAAYAQTDDSHKATNDTTMNSFACKCGPDCQCGKENPTQPCNCGPGCQCKHHHNHSAWGLNTFAVTPCI